MLDLEARVARLESQNRRLRASVGMIATIAFSLLLLGQSSEKQHRSTIPDFIIDWKERISGGPLFPKDQVPECLFARRFVVVNESGDPTVVISSSPSTGSGRIETFAAGALVRRVTIDTNLEAGSIASGMIITHAENGEPLLQLTARTGGGAIAVHDSSGTELISLGAGSSGHGTMVARDIEGSPLVGIGAHAIGAVRGGAITTFGSDGTPLVAILANQRGSGTITTNNQKGIRQVAIGANVGDNGTVTTYDAGGVPLIHVGTTLDGAGTVSALDRAGGVRKQWP